MKSICHLLVRTLSAGVLVAACHPAWSLVDNFTLLDHNGAAHELYYQSDAKALVIMVQGNGCPIVRNAWHDLKVVRDAYENRGVRFWMLNANLQDSRATIAAEAAEWGYDMPILVDSTQLIGESLALVRTGEVLVIDPGTWEITYRGPMHDRLTYERQKAAVGEHYLSDTLDAMLADEPVEVAERDAVGCLINFPDAKPQHHQTISYSSTVAPILERNCAVCHRPGGIGPWAMTSFEMIRGFAPMIREVVRTKRMPPWHADPHIGAWQGDRSLSEADMKTLVHWIEAGAPRGDGPDPLTRVTAQTDDWPLGPPDLIVEVPGFEVPASGVVDYQFPVVDNPLTDDAWVRAATVVPGDRAVVHHVLVGSSDPGTSVAQNNESVFDNYIIGYAPGNETMHMPDGTGVYVPGWWQVPATDALHAGRPGRDRPHACGSVLLRRPTGQFPASPGGTEPGNRHSTQRSRPRGVRVLRTLPGRRALSHRTARPLPRAQFDVRGRLPGRPHRSTAVGAKLRLQLAAHLRVRGSANPACRQPPGTPHDLRQLRAEPGQSGSEPARAVGTAVVGRDALRRVQFRVGRRNVD